MTATHPWQAPAVHLLRTARGAESGSTPDTTETSVTSLLPSGPA